jgi:hypothetical protein
LSRNLELMRANEWLEEVSADDARVHSYRLTQKGSILLNEAIPAWRNAQGEAIRLLGDAAVEALREFAQVQGFGR